MFVSTAAAEEPPRKRNKTTAGDTDAMEKVGFLFILLFDTNTNLNFARRSPLWTSLGGRL